MIEKLTYKEKWLFNKKNYDCLIGFMIFAIYRPIK